MRASQSQQPNNPFGAWEDFWYTVTTSKLLITGVFLATLAGAYLGLQTQDDLYESQARILVKLGRENMDAPVTVANTSAVPTGIRKEEIFTHIILISSRPIIEQTLDEIGIEAFRPVEPTPTTVFGRLRQKVRAGVRRLKEGFEELLIALNIQKRLTFHDKVLLGLEKALFVERDKESDVILVRLRLPVPDLAQRFLTVLLRRYRDAHIEVRRDPTSSDFFEKTSGAYLDRLRAYEADKSRIRATYNLSSIGEERLRLLARLHELYGEIEADQRDLAMLPDATEDAKPATRDELSPSNPSTALIKDRITQQRMRRLEMLSRFQADSDEVRNLDDEIAALESSFARALNRRIAVKKQQAVAIEKRMSDINIAEDKMDSLERQRVQAVQNYNDYAHRLEESRISEELDRRRVANISVLGAPTLPLQPVAPARRLITALSIPTGLFLGIAMAVLLQGLSDRIQRPRDLGAIEGLSYLGTFDLRRPSGSQ
jgi:uncharacterized protein involved in exopolysaccharide biosynthesis